MGSSGDGGGTLTLKEPTNIRTKYDEKAGSLEILFEEDHIMYLLKKFHSTKKPVLLKLDVPQKFRKIPEVMMSPTGRIANRQPEMQRLPSDSKLSVDRPEMVEADYSEIEKRITAQLTEIPKSKKLSWEK